MSHPAWPIRRPTEHAALREITRTPAPAPDLADLFAALLTALDNDDRHGVALFGHTAARIAGGHR